MEADSEVGDLMAVSSSRPGVAGVAYLPFLKGSASLSSLDDRGSSSHVGMAYRPWLAGSASRSPLGTVALVRRPADVGIVLLRLADIVDGHNRPLLGVGA